MYPNWFGTFCAAAALLAFFISHRLALKMPRKKRALWALAAVILAIPGASFAAYYAHLVSEPAWYYEFRSWRGTEALLIVVGIAGGLVASILPWLGTTLPFVIVGSFVIVPFLKPFIGPFEAGTLRDRWDGEVCLQSTPSTCGAASTATIFRQLGVTITEAELAEEAHSYSGGTEVWYLARALRRRGHQPQFRQSEGFDPDLPFPALVGVRFGSVGHFIAILSRKGDQFHLGDPLRGSEKLTLEEMRQRYDYTGFSMISGRPRG